MGRLRLYGLVFWVICATTLLFAQDNGKQYILDSSHNLSVSGPGPVKASTETQVCIFCHTPHSASPAAGLWNHVGSAVTYQVYSSTTMNAPTGVPTQASKLCLSCHDGTIGLGQTVGNGNINVADTSGTLLDPDTSFSSTASPNLGGASGSELLNDHPFSFAPIQDGLLVAGVTNSPPNPSVPEVQLRNGAIECISCHEPHRQDLDAITRKFLVGSNVGGRLCLACHQQSLANNYWNLASHNTSAKTTPTVPASSWAGYGTVAGDSCMACHATHSATVNQRLLRAQEENTCFLCHGSSNTIASYNIQAEFNKVGSVAGVIKYAHPTVAVTPSVHDPAELPPPINGYPRATAPAMPETSPGQPRHAECVDCHNPHAANATGAAAIPPAVPSNMNSVTGVSGTATDGRTPVTPAAYEYQICFVCHGDSANKPQNTSYSDYGRTVFRQTYATVSDPFNERLDFASTASRHNVTQARAAISVPSLRNYILNLDGSTGRFLGSGTYIYCADCHNNDQARGSKGPGPNGPHGSIWSHLLERRYDVEGPPSVPGANDGQTVNSGTVAPGIATTNYALCDKCHDVAALLTDATFKHSVHVIGAGASCSTCHAGHGIQQQVATNGNTNNRLLDPDTKIVGPVPSGTYAGWLVMNTNTRTCYLQCHGTTHTGSTY